MNEQTSSKVDSIYKVDDDSIYGFFKEHRYLSNFHLCEIEYEGRMYISTENAFQAAKTLNLEERKHFEKCPPADSKHLGRQVVLRPNWDDMKDKLMYDLCKQKFTKHEYLKSLLLATEGKYLEETNWWNDRYWGAGFNHTGENKLGKILMRIRGEIISSI